ncbi:MAG: HsdM family class I SAM-dependent methyltransferase [Planctomycetota bacterium]|jgi:hypothetical protein
MAVSFKSKTQRGMYDAVLRGLSALGYSGDLLIEDYRFGDWFAQGVPERTIPAAAFGQTPVSYDSACFGVVLANGESHRDLVARHRALGAPIVFEVADTSLRQWVVARSEHDSQQLVEIAPGEIDKLFSDNASNWTPDHFLRAKNIVDFRWNRQLGLFAGLLPDLEHEIQEKLDPMLRNALSAASREYRKTSSKNPDPEKLYQLIFWLLAGKVFRDRGRRQFCEIGLNDGPDAVLEAVAHHYRTDVPKLLTRGAREEGFARIWLRMDFRNLSVDVLSHIWSTTLVTAELKKRLGIHRTPRAIAKYIVERIPFDTVGDGHRTIVEPCCGSGVFLVAAMNRLRSFLWGSSPQDRQRYFRRHLVGLEEDPFGVEIAKLALALADFPNPNGWQVSKDDVFDRESQFASALKHAGVVLCNPPFEVFTKKERVRYAPASVKKPVELLNRVLDSLHPQGLLGFVLPRNILDGQGYDHIRGRLARRFATIELTALPDKAFDADHEVALLIATDPIPHDRVLVAHRKVKDAANDWNRFVWHHAVSSEESLHKSFDTAAESLAIPELLPVWEALEHHETLKDVAVLHRGIEWNKPLTLKGKETGHREEFVRTDKTKGFREGVPPRARFSCFETPESRYLSMRPEDQRTTAYRFPWGQPKVILNKSARSRGPWRIAAFADQKGWPCYQTFIGAWPKGHIDLVALAAVLNGPVANAFVSTREGKTDISVETLKSIPVPRFTASQIKSINRSVTQYLQSVPHDKLMFREQADDPEMLLKTVDATVLAAYDLPPRLERSVLDFFNSHGDKRPVHCVFQDYFPSDLESYFSLAEYLSPDFREATVGRLLQRMGTR